MRAIHVHFHRSADAGFDESKIKRDEDGRFTGASSAAGHKAHEFDHKQESERHKKASETHYELASAAMRSGGGSDEVLKNIALGAAHRDAHHAHEAAHHHHGAAGGSDEDRKTYGEKANAATKHAVDLSSTVAQRATEIRAKMKD